METLKVKILEDGKALEVREPIFKYEINNEEDFQQMAEWIENYKDKKLRKFKMENGICECSVPNSSYKHCNMSCGKPCVGSTYNAEIINETTVKILK